MLDYGFVCERATDAGSALHARNIVRKVNLPRFPAVLQGLTLVAALPPGVGGRNVRVRLARDGKMVCAWHPVSGSSAPGACLVLTLDSVPFDSPGEYRFEVLAGEDVVGVIPFRVLPAAVGPSTTPH